MTILIDGTVKAKALWAGIVGSGLVQINMGVRDLTDGDHFLPAEINGVRSPTNAYFTISRSN